ncbi:TetR/AcrR family transcriptional regulator [Nocardioides coralli]|uniref:TetR/AcrR family transcriptional regulator n=1 Tax=Nocardioides coralli TaxID=2872154 RepID=UPI001CA3D230|nr:TetR/AcrR family transcriptional regulator [Nocardioides coralli]QZY28407.1 TetR/AcrR family transcriptional regulator [Nocardioides coralli]
MLRQILDAAWAIARDEGFAAVSLREVAARVGMRAPSLYTYVASKDAIFDAMFADAQRELADALPDLDLAGGPRARLRVGARAFLEFCAADPVRYLLMFQRPVPGFEPSPESYALAVDNLAVAGRALAALGLEEQHHLDLWTAVVGGLAAQQLSNEPGGDRWLRLADDAVEMYADHVGLPPDPTEEMSSS